jgi:hypothetical protein
MHRVTYSNPMTTIWMIIQRSPRFPPYTQSRHGIVMIKGCQGLEIDGGYPWAGRV